jgi:ketosteroid isomerase-like protein
MNAASPREVFEKLITGIGEGRWEELGALYAEDAVVDQPLMAPDPVRITGRAQIAAHFAGAARMGFRVRPRNIVVHTTGDPEVVIAEFDYDTPVEGAQQPLTSANVQVLRVRDGQIVQTRDYHDHLRLAARTGRAAQLGAAMDASARS